MMEIMNKKCKKCKIIKPIKGFHKDKHHKDGFKNTCISCKSQISKEWYFKNHDRLIQKLRDDKMKKPWMTHLRDANYRCNNSNHPDFHRYGGRGIQQLMADKDFKFLWLRDKAYLMKHPSIHRIKNDKNYTIDNCQFLEHREHVITDWKRRKDGQNN
jgi:hypothetical protein